MQPLMLLTVVPVRLPVAMRLDGPLRREDYWYTLALPVKSVMVV